LAGKHRKMMFLTIRRFVEDLQPQWNANTKIKEASALDWLIAVNEKTASRLFCPFCTFSITSENLRRHNVDNGMLWSRCTSNGHKAKIS